MHKIRLMKYLAILLLFPVCLSAQKEYPSLYYQQNAVIQAPLYDTLEAQKKQAPTGKRQLKNLELTRPSYTPSRQFLQFKGDSCFNITKREADLAFAKKYWDDAAKLYRAAKSCADANQSERQRMNDKIAQCKEAANAELREKEREAVRQARHAIADNLATEAQRMLSQFDRTMAYRLADFANQYIAPSNNPKCIQAMLDAWYYKPSVQNQTLQVPFCYQLAGNMPRNTKVAQLGKGTNGKIYAYGEGQNLLWTWSASNFEPQEPILLKDNYDQFEAAPDGKTLIFSNKEEVLFWRGPNQFVPVHWKNDGISPVLTYVTPYQFYYYDVNEKEIYSINYADFFGMKKGPVTRKIEPERFFTHNSSALSSFAVQGADLWLHLDGQLEIWRYNTRNKTWDNNRTYSLADFPATVYRSVIYPEANRILIQSDTSLLYVLDASVDSSKIIPVFLQFPGEIMAVSADAQLTTRMLQADGNNLDRLVISENTNGNVLFGVFVNQNDWLTQFGAFSPDKRWLFALSYTGALYAWDLSARQNDWLKNLPKSDTALLGPDGSVVVRLQDKKIWFHQAEQPEQAPREIGTAAKLLAVSEKGVLVLNLDQKLAFLPFINGMELPLPLGFRSDVATMARIDPQSKYAAVVENGTSLHILDLSTFSEMPVKSFNEQILDVQFIPNSSQVVLVLKHLGDDPNKVRTTAKIWDYAHPESKMKAVRLHNYKISKVVVSQNGEKMAFSNNTDVRVFNCNELLDELARNNHWRSGQITSLCFMENQPVLAMGFEDGSIELWDLTNTDQNRRLPAMGNTETNGVQSMVFLNKGAQLRQLNGNNTLATRDLNPESIRSKAQSTYRRLLPFNYEQIQAYNLEAALNYPGNFEQLATSGEWPLIRSFFEYYARQASQSNNILQVEAYCERAFVLYQKLGDETRKLLQNTLLQMYSDFHWKLVLRNNLSRAETIVATMNAEFNSPPEAQQAAAFTALLKGDTRTASNQFSDWVFSLRKNQILATNFDNQPLDTLKGKIEQLAEYELLGSDQINCICALFNGLLDLGDLCTGSGAKDDDLSLNPEKRLRWNIIRYDLQAENTINYAQKDQYWQKAYVDAQALQRFNANEYRHLLHEISFKRAENLFSWGVFEMQSPLALKNYQQSIALLEGLKASRNSLDSDSSQLFLLANNYANIGTYFADKNQLNEAINAYKKGLTYLGGQLSADSEYNYSIEDNLAYQLYDKLGTSWLKMGKAAEALICFEKSEKLLLYASPVGLGLSKFLLHDEDAALLSLGQINDERSLGEAIYLLNDLADRFPDQAADMNRFAEKLHRLIILNRQLDSNTVDYWVAAQQFNKNVGLEQWEKALQWSKIALEKSARAIETSNNSYLIKEFWLNEQINQSYYLILAHSQDEKALNQSIAYSEGVQIYVEGNYPNYPNLNLVKTNLGHAYWLRNKGNDREKSIQTYQEYLKNQLGAIPDPWEILLKDFRDMQQHGVRFEHFDDLIQAIQPAQTN